MSIEDMNIVSLGDNFGIQIELARPSDGLEIAYTGTFSENMLTNVEWIQAGYDSVQVMVLASLLEFIVEEGVVSKVIEEAIANGFPLVARTIELAAE